MAMPDWDRFLLDRERLRRAHLSDDLIRDLEAMGPVAARPLVDALLAAPSRVIAKINATQRQIQAR